MPEIGKEGRFYVPCTCGEDIATYIGTERNGEGEVTHLLRCSACGADIGVRICRVIQPRDYEDDRDADHAADNVYPFPEAVRDD